MSVVQDPNSTLTFYELSHEWGHGAPALPGYADVKLYRSSQHAKNGVMAHRLRMVMHSGTHLNAPRHLIPKGAGVGDIAMDRLFGNGCVLSIPKKQWELVMPADLDHAGPGIRPGDIVTILTGWHHRYSDSQEYFGRSPGLSAEAARWLVARDIRLLAMDTPQIDHPLATSLGPHRNGPQMKRLAEEYQRETGGAASVDFPDWFAAHRVLLGAGIPTIENVGGAIDALAGRRATFHAMPWNWPEGDACPVRLVGITDRTGGYRVSAGEPS